VKESFDSELRTVELLLRKLILAPLGVEAGQAETTAQKGELAARLGSTSALGETSLLAEPSRDGRQRLNRQEAWRINFG